MDVVVFDPDFWRYKTTLRVYSGIGVFRQEAPVNHRRSSELKRNARRISVTVQAPHDARGEASARERFGRLAMKQWRVSSARA
jgi:hypothetical protein